MVRGEWSVVNKAMNNKKSVIRICLKNYENGRPIFRHGQRSNEFIKAACFAASQIISKAIQTLTYPIALSPAHSSMQ